MTTDSCKKLTAVSRRVALWISHQAAVGEESVTDWILFEISRRLRSVRYVKFTRLEEGRTTGADWEWWFVSRRLSLGMRIQAKMVNWDADNYPALAYANRYGLQIEKLREDAARRGLLAFYALYGDGRHVDGLACRGMPDVGRGQGVFLSDANKLYRRHVEAGRSQVGGADLLEGSSPLSCFACCPLVQWAPGVEGLYEYIRRFHVEAVDGGGDLIPEGRWTPGDRMGLHPDPPRYVSSLLQSEDGSVLSWWEREFDIPSDEARALLVFDLRGNR
jgi:hypothetical protein